MSQERNYFDIVNGYLAKDDNSRNNANFIYSLPTLNSLVAGAVIKDFWFDEVYKDYKGVKARDLYDE